MEARGYPREYLTPWRVISKIPNIFYFDCVAVALFENSFACINAPGGLV
jgi:hypothetical protein